MLDRVDLFECHRQQSMLSSNIFAVNYINIFIIKKNKDYFIIEEIKAIFSESNPIIEEVFKSLNREHIYVLYSLIHSVCCSILC